METTPNEVMAKIISSSISAGVGAITFRNKMAALEEGCKSTTPPKKKK